MGHGRDSRGLCLDKLGDTDILLFPTGALVSGLIFGSAAVLGKKAEPRVEKVRVGEVLKPGRQVAAKAQARWRRELAGAREKHPCRQRLKRRSSWSQSEAGVFARPSHLELRFSSAPIRHLAPVQLPNSPPAARFLGSGFLVQKGEGVSSRTAGPVAPGLSEPEARELPATCACGLLRG